MPVAMVTYPTGFARCANAPAHMKGKAMSRAIKDLTISGIYAPEDLAVLERVYLSVCGMLDLDVDDQFARRVVAKAVLFAYDRGARTIDDLKAAAIIASKTPLLERSAKIAPAA